MVKKIYEHDFVEPESQYSVNNKINLNYDNLSKNDRRFLVKDNHLEGNLFGRNHLVIFILVRVCYLFSIFYSIFKIYIFVAFCCVQSVAFLRIFSAFLADISAFLPHFTEFLRCLFCHFVVLF